MTTSHFAIDALYNPTSHLDRSRIITNRFRCVKHFVLYGSLVAYLLLPPECAALPPRTPFRFCGTRCHWNPFNDQNAPQIFNLHTALSRTRSITVTVLKPNTTSHINANHIAINRVDFGLGYHGFIYPHRSLSHSSIQHFPWPTLALHSVFRENRSGP